MEHHNEEELVEEYYMDDAGEGMDGENEEQIENPTEMAVEITRAFIRRMGVTGGGLDRLSQCKNPTKKKRFWMQMLQELEQLGPVGCKSPQALVTKWNNLCTKFKKAKLVSNKSGSGKTKFIYYDIMMSEVGTKPKFSSKAVLNSRAAKVVQETEMPATKKCKAADSRIFSPVDDFVLENNEDESSLSSDDDQRTRRSRMTLQEQQLSEQKKTRRVMQQTAQARDEKNDVFFEKLLGQGEQIKDAMVRGVENQQRFNDRFFGVLDNFFSNR
jgi:hypothetical protein